VANGVDRPHSSLSVTHILSLSTTLRPLVQPSGAWGTPFRSSLSVEAAASTGSAQADASHTLKLVSITFEDGTTPESHGFDLAFASGMPSPNLVALPGPALASPSVNPSSLPSEGGDRTMTSSPSDHVGPTGAVPVGVS